jgi:hypothetical protein
LQVKYTVDGAALLVLVSGFATDSFAVDVVQLLVVLDVVVVVVVVVAGAALGGGRLGGMVGWRGVRMRE